MTCGLELPYQKRVLLKLFNISNMRQFSLNSSGIKRGKLGGTLTVPQEQ